METRNDSIEEVEVAPRSLLNNPQETNADMLRPVEFADVLREALPDRVIYFVNVPDRF